MAPVIHNRLRRGGRTVLAAAGATVVLGLAGCSIDLSNLRPGGGEEPSPEPAEPVAAAPLVEQALTDLAAYQGLVATGLGFAIMSRVIAAKELQLGQLVQVPLSPPLIRNFSVVYPKERFHSKLVAAFLQFAKDQLAAGQRLLPRKGLEHHACSSRSDGRPPKAPGRQTMILIISPGRRPR
jgi:DNA-binding transcriptional LysR family regulator